MVQNKYKVYLIFTLLIIFPQNTFSDDFAERYLKKAKQFQGDYRFETVFEMANLSFVTAESALPVQSHIDYYILLSIWRRSQ